MAGLFAVQQLFLISNREVAGDRRAVVRSLKQYGARANPTKARLGRSYGTKSDPPHVWISREGRSPESLNLSIGFKQQLEPLSAASISR